MFHFVPISLWYLFPAKKKVIGDIHLINRIILSYKFRENNPLWKFNIVYCQKKFYMFFWTPYISNVDTFFFLLIGFLGQIWRQRNFFLFQVKLGKHFLILSDISCCSYIFFQFMKKKKSQNPFQGYFSSDPDFLIMGLTC